MNNNKVKTVYNLKKHLENKPNAGSVCLKITKTRHSLSLPFYFSEGNPDVNIFDRSRQAIS